MDPACAPFNLPKNATFIDCCQMKVQMIPSDVFQKCAAQFPKVISRNTNVEMNMHIFTFF